MKMTKYLAIFLTFCMILGIASQASTQDGQLAPDGEASQTYYAPFPLHIELDSDLSDWEGVPRVLMSGNDHSVIFAAAADEQFIYFMGDVTDSNIITGQHAENYWNEDSIEFYINGTGDLSLRTYTDGVAQITIPALNMDLALEDTIFSGVRGSSANAQAKVFQTETGYAVEVAVPLQNDVWEITPAHGEVIGFQVHLNGSSGGDRDTKLIWSVFDASDQSYLNPSVFGYLIFYEIGQTDIPELPEEEGSAAADLPQVSASALYRSSSFSTEVRVNDLMSRMTLDEKIGQMTLVEKNSMLPDDITEFGIGGLLSGGGGYPDTNTPEEWAAMVNGYQDYALDSRLVIPLIYGVDAVHGHNNVYGAVIFPHNVGLGATRNPELVEEICRITAIEMIATGIYWNYSPVLAVPQDIRWGRTYEGFGEDTQLVTDLAIACMRGLQGDDLSDPLTVLATPKHFVGDGGAVWGTSTTGDYQIDQGVTDVDEATLRAIHLPPYIAAVDNGAQSIMISFSSWDGMKMHAQRYLITDVLKGELGFEGFIVSDWAGIDQISDDYYEAVVTAINAGVDMNMVPYDYLRFMATVKQAVNNGDIPLSRIDDAVRRILIVKFNLGLFENPYANEDLLADVGSESHRAVARQAVAESQVLLQNNEDLLPLSPETQTIFVAGVAADDIGIQSGGWTIEWQGSAGDITPGTTILDGIEQSVSSGTRVEYDPAGLFEEALHEDGSPIIADVGIVVVGERPYAEGLGDNTELVLSEEDIAAIENARARSNNLIVIIVSGRPLIVTDYLDDWDALVAAWLPGTEGQGVADVLFGYQPFTGTLPLSWPVSVDQLPLSADNEYLFPYGFGLQVTAVQ